MTRLFQPLWRLLASTADSELAPVVECLQTENRILRARLPDRITMAQRERERLIRSGSVLGAALASVITIVSSRTLRCWATSRVVRARTRRFAN
jgi:putative transposase